MRSASSKMPRELSLGDIIADGSKQGTKVTDIAHYACSKRGTHVNGKDCYPWSIPVSIFAK